MEYEFDPTKAESNLSKHGVAMSEGEGVLNDPLCRSMPDVMTEGEQRFVGIGSNLFGQLRVIVYTYRNENAVRAISVRRPDPSEVRTYEEGI
jgi:uncharacterized protein